MAKYHVNAGGDPGVCSATHGKCPFGGEDNHFTSLTEAYDSIAGSAELLTSISAVRKDPAIEAIVDSLQIQHNILLNSTASSKEAKVEVIAILDHIDSLVASEKKRQEFRAKIDESFALVAKELSRPRTAVEVEALVQRILKDYV